jgi:hypothetical protein
MQGRCEIRLNQIDTVAKLCPGLYKSNGIVPLSEEFVRMWTEPFVANLKVQTRHIAGSIRGNHKNLQYPPEYNPVILKMEAERPS